MCKGTAFLRNLQLYLYVVQHVFLCCTTYFPNGHKLHYVQTFRNNCTFCRCLQQDAQNAKTRRSGRKLPELIVRTLKKI